MQICATCCDTVLCIVNNYGVLQVNFTHRKGQRVECSLYVDDFLIVYRSKYIHIIERHLQRSINMLSHWADTNGFKFSSSKTVCMHFCRLRNAHPNPELTLNGTLIPVVEQTKFLGVIFDNKFTFLTSKKSV